MKKIALVFIANLFFCCNSDTKRSNNYRSDLDIANDIFELKLKVKSTSADEFKIMLNSIKDSENLINLHARKLLKGNNVSQIISLKTDAKYFPEELIVDLGKNKKEVIIEEVYLKTKNIDLEITRQKMNHYFHTNKFLKFDENNLKYIVENSRKSQLLIFRQRIIDSLWLNK